MFGSFLAQMNVKNFPSSMRCQDSNSRPLDDQSPPITTRPELPPFLIFFGSYPRLFTSLTQSFARFGANFNFSTFRPLLGFEPLMAPPLRRFAFQNFFLIFRNFEIIFFFEILF